MVKVRNIQRYTFVKVHHWWQHCQSSDTDFI